MRKKQKSDEEKCENMENIVVGDDSEKENHIKNIEKDEVEKSKMEQQIVVIDEVILKEKLQEEDKKIPSASETVTDEHVSNTDKSTQNGKTNETHNEKPKLTPVEKHQNAKEVVNIDSDSDNSNKKTTTRQRIIKREKMNTSMTERK